MSQDCIFCKIVSGEIPSKKIFENESILAFEDVNPVAPVHTLVVPKKHYENILDISSSEAGLADLNQLMAALPKVAEELGVEESGFRLKGLPQTRQSLLNYCYSAFFSCFVPPPLRYALTSYSPPR